MNHYYLSSAKPPLVNKTSTDKRDFVRYIYAYSITSELWQTFGSTIDYWNEKGVPENEIPIEKIVFRKIGDFRGHMQTDQKNELVNIVLNKRFIDSFSVDQFSQILFMEIGNYINRNLLGNIIDHSNNYAKKEFIEAIEKLEFDVRLEIIYAYEAGQFPSCIFDTASKNFENYMIDPRGKAHREAYGNVWEAYKK